MSKIEIEKNYFIYILELSDNKYYVGKTSNASSRLAEHIKNIGASWTKKYKTKKVHKIYKNCNSFDEDKYTVMYMAIFGIDNVRGGSFCSISLSHAERTVLIKMIDSASDKCFKCGSTDHFARNCENNTDPNDRLEPLISWCKEASYSDNIYVILDEKSNKKYEFGPDGHDITDIPSTNERFEKKISRKHNASLFKLSVSSYDFHLKSLKTEGYVILYNSEGLVILCDDSDMTSVMLKKLHRSINAMLETGEFIEI